MAVAADSRLFTRHCCESWRRRNNLDGAWHQRADGGCQPLFAVSVRRAREVHDEGRCVADLGTQVVRKSVGRDFVLDDAQDSCVKSAAL